MTKPRVDLGRKGMHDPIIRAQLLGMVEAGVALSAAARAVGVCPSTVHAWLRDGDAHLQRADDTGEDLSPRARFAQDYAGAVAGAQSVMLARISAASADDWRAAAWVLERRWPADYGPRQRVDMDHRADVDARDIDRILERVDAAIAIGDDGDSEGTA